MARGYAAGRAHIRELNHGYYVSRRPYDSKEGGDKAIEGPMSKHEATDRATKNNIELGALFIYEALPESILITTDSEGVARLKANPKL